MMQPADDARIREITARLVAAFAPERVLVTGGAGYIGSHACQALHAAG